MVHYLCFYVRSWKPFSLGVGLLLFVFHFVFAQEIDVSVKAADDQKLHVKWYTQAQNERFQVVLTNLQTQKETTHVISGSRELEVENIDTQVDYSITVNSLDDRGMVLSFGKEEFQGISSLQAYTRNMAAKITPKNIAANLQISMQSLNAQSFPFIYSTIDVSDGIAGIDNLTVNDFKAYEDGVRQLDFFNVTPAGTGGGTRILDMIFLIDDSGSMGEEQQAVVDNVNHFVDQLVLKNIDFRLGLVRFGHGISHEIVLMNNANFTSNVEYFKQMLNTFTVSGGYEHGLQAVYNAAVGFSFRPASQRHFLLITDEDSNGDDLASAINVCNNNGIIVHTAVDCAYGVSQTDYCGPNSIRGQTGGILKSVIGPYDDILDAILQDVASSYIVQYRTTNDVITSGQREVKINVDALGQNKNVIGYYGFGWPIITLTTATANLSNTAQIQSVPIVIRAKVTDSSQPFVQSVLCYYRRTGTATYNSMTMIDTGNNIFEATIPGNVVLEPGVDYYIKATDGQTTSTYPELDPSIYPVQIAVLPNQPPLISHTPVLSGTVGASVSINAVVTDYTNSVAAVKLFYRKYGTLIYTSVAMTLSGGTYSANIPGSIITTNGVEYYIRAVDDLGIASINGVHLLETNGGGTGNCPPDLADNFEDGNANGWSPLNPGRWEVAQEGAYYYYGINTTLFDPIGTEALGELSVLNSQNYEDFKLSVYAKSSENLNTNAFADFAVVFGYVDAQNYHYLMINGTRDWSQVFQIENNVRTTLFDLNTQIDDNSFHLIHLEKKGTTLDVYYDGFLVGSHTNIIIPAGRMGVGSYNDGAYFDDFQITTDCTPTNNLPPVIHHSPITTAAPGSVINIAASVTDHTDYVDYVRLYYRKKGTAQYTLANMPLSGSKYVTTIPASAVATSGVEYFIAATDNLGLSAQTAVYTINVIAGTNCPADFTDAFEDGNASEWTLYNPSRWSFQNDNGNMKFYINTTQYLSPDGHRLGEFAVVNGKYYGDFTLKCAAKTETAGPTNYFADLAIIFGFQDEFNYYYVGYNSKEEYTGLHVIQNGIRTELAIYDPATMGDGAYHDVQITRTGSTIYIYYDGQVIITAENQIFGIGQVGIGSYNDQAWFDNFTVEACGSSGNSPPQIMHTPVATASAGASIPISATITDVTDYVLDAKLHFRSKGVASFVVTGMNANGSTYSAMIPHTYLTDAGLEYFIDAFDNLGLSSTTPIHHIRKLLPPCNGDFSDDFEDGNADGWQPVTPAYWEVSYVDGSNVYNLHTASSGDEWSLLSAKKWGDFAIEFDARSTAAINKNYTLLFAVPTLADGNDNGYYLKFGVNSVELYRLVNGSGTPIKSVGQDYVNDNYYHHLRVERDGAIIRVRADGNLLFEHTDNTWQSGYIGLNVFKSTSRFDNICITALQPEATITMPGNADVSPGQNVIIPVKLSTAQNISFLQLTFDYDSNLLNFVGADIGAGVPGFTIGEINANPSFPPYTPGTNKNVIVQLSGGGTNSVSGNDIHILNLEFLAVGSINTFSPLEIDKDCTHSFLTTSDPFDMCGNTLHTNRCNVVISQSNSISGTISYYTQGKPVTNTTVELRENNQFVKSVISDSSGVYKLSNLATVPYVINASKSGNIGSAITGSDVLLAMRAIAFIINLDPGQKIAADVDKNDRVTGADVVAILRYLAFVQTGIAECGTWRFMPENGQINPGNTNQYNFAGHILGDINGSWQGNNAPKIGSPARLAWDVRINDGDNLTFALHVAGQSIVHTGQISLDWEIEPKTVPVFIPAGDALAASSKLVDGKMHFAFASLEGFRDGEKIGEFQVQVPKQNMELPLFLRVAKAVVNDFPGDLPDVEQQTIQSVLPEKVELYANYPNPFNIKTRIKFYLPSAYSGQNVYLQMYTITGKKIRDLLQQEIESGVHEVIWDGRDARGEVVSSGVYLYRLQVGSVSQTKKLMLLK
ncbi:MAG: VWA domain-containing protein [Calditrichaeota bacterium]|nr:MAG: VWA domain-containing protein [Calditrichota bacterium]